MIKNIVFDLGNVILKGTPSIILDQLNLDKSEYIEIKNKFFCNFEKLDLGLETLEQHFSLCDFSFKIDDDLKNKLLRYYEIRPFNNEVLNLIKTLKNNNYNIYILSDNNKETIQYLKSLPFFLNIDGYICSSDYNILKSDKKIYELLFLKYNLNPEECFFIDDKNRNIEIGKSFKMDGYVFNNNIDELKLVLNDKGIIIN